MRSLIAARMSETTSKHIQGCAISQDDELPICQHVNFSSRLLGTATKELQPCDIEFLETLLRDFVITTQLHFVKKLRNMSLYDAQYIPDTDEAYKLRMRQIMGHCRRLNATPELFPSATLKADFLNKIARLSKETARMQNVILQISKFDIDASAQIREIQRPYSDMAASHEREHIPKSSNRVPLFLPDQVGGKLPWNNWLDNSARYFNGWTTIQQKLPRTGEKLFRQITLMYDAVEAEFTLNNLLITAPKNNSQLPAPGDDIKHMTWSGFCTVPVYHLGFVNGQRKKYDTFGVVTLEHLSALAMQFMDGNDGVRQETSNCPYFRYAIAGLKK